MYRLTVTYAAEDGGKFDFDYYRDVHMPMVMDRVGADAVKFEVSKGMFAGDGGRPHYTCIGQVYLSSLDGFQKAMEQHGAEIMGDVPNYTNIAPTVQIEEMVA